MKKAKIIIASVFAGITLVSVFLFLTAHYNKNVKKHYFPVR